MAQTTFTKAFKQCEAKTNGSQMLEFLIQILRLKIIEHVVDRVAITDFHFQLTAVASFLNIPHGLLFSNPMQRFRGFMPLTF